MTRPPFTTNDLKPEMLEAVIEMANAYDDTADLVKLLEMFAEDVRRPTPPTLGARCHDAFYIARVGHKNVPEHRNSDVKAWKAAADAVLKNSDVATMVKAGLKVTVEQLRSEGFVKRADVLAQVDKCLGGGKLRRSALVTKLVRRIEDL